MKHGFLVFETDQHTGHVEGLLPREVEVYDLENGGLVTFETKLSPTQERLLKIREDNIAALPDLVKRKPWAYINLGDQTQGTKYTDDVQENDAITQANAAYQNAVAIADIRPAPKWMRFLAGTPSHSPMDRYIASMHLERQLHGDVKTLWHNRIVWDGFRVEVKHNGPNRGYRWWTRENPAINFLKDQMLRDLGYGKKPAHLYAYGHIHEHHRALYALLDNGDWYHSTLLTVPSMCGVGSYPRKTIANLQSLENGWIIVEIKDNDIHEIHSWTHTLDLTHTEML